LLHLLGENSFFIFRNYLLHEPSPLQQREQSEARKNARKILHKCSAKKTSVEFFWLRLCRLIKFKCFCRHFLCRLDRDINHSTILNDNFPIMTAELCLFMLLHLINPLMLLRWLLRSFISSPNINFYYIIFQSVISWAEIDCAFYAAESVEGHFPR
jgi:hypothetical protein